jgi:PAS domain S-box-containing protein
MRRARHHCDEEARQLIAEGTNVEKDWGEGTSPQMQFAVGTREVERLVVEVLEQRPAALELGAQAMFVLDADGAIEDVNADAESLVGFARADLIGQRLKFLGGDTTQPANHVRSFAARIHDRDGHEIVVDVVLYASRTNTTTIFMTPRSGEDGARSNEVVEIVHDLKNPLSTIALEMHLLETIDKQELRTIVSRVNQNVAFLDRMVGDLLDASSMEADSFRAQREPKELRGLIEEVIERSIATRDRGRVVFHAAEQVALSVDALRIDRVVANLLSNALKYSMPSTPVVLRLETRAGFARVSVSDTGPGIPDGQTELVFAKYGRAKNSRGREGNGLGLYVSKRIIEAHGGRIGVHSVEGVGSCFFFELPLDA